MAAARILIVEDNEMNWDMLSRWLRRRGYEVHVATDGEQGVERAKELQPDLILMDVSLPILDGYGATRLLRTDAATRDTIVIALTAHALSGSREEALAAGCDDFVSKPVELHSLHKLMEHLLAGRASRKIALQ
jgi:CheY-like chemotaxis protein